jgi:hypothetical protein
MQMTLAILLITESDNYMVKIYREKEKRTREGNEEEKRNGVDLLICGKRVGGGGGEGGEPVLWIWIHRIRIQHFQ